MKYRSQTEIIQSILQTVIEETTKTRIMYKSYLSSTQLKDYLALLLEKELISYQPETRLYKITGNGLEYLAIYSEIRQLITLPVTTKS